MYQADDPKYDKATGTAEEYFWEPDTPTSRHASQCGGNLGRQASKSFERFDCKTCGWMSWVAK